MQIQFASNKKDYPTKKEQPLGGTALFKKILGKNL